MVLFLLFCILHNLGPSFNFIDTSCFIWFSIFHTVKDFESHASGKFAILKVAIFCILHHVKTLVTSFPDNVMSRYFMWMMYNYSLFESNNRLQVILTILWIILHSFLKCQSFLVGLLWTPYWKFLAKFKLPQLCKYSILKCPGLELDGQPLVEHALNPIIPIFHCCIVSPKSQIWSHSHSQNSHQSFCTLEPNFSLSLQKFTIQNYQNIFNL